MVGMNLQNNTKNENNIQIRQDIVEQNSVREARLKNIHKHTLQKWN